MDARRGDVLLAEFDAYLRTVRGATARTRCEYTRYVREYIDSRHGATIEVARLRAADLIGFVVERAGRCAAGTAKLVATSLRSFLRFLQVHGLCEARLVGAIPTVPNWKLARLPKTLDDEQLRALLDAFDRASDTGRRDYAMALCMSHLGLRAGEVARLAIDDINWRAGTLRIAVGKARRDGTLPLPVNVGQAIATYVRRARPSTAERRVFVRHRVGAGRPLSSSAVCSAIRRGFARSGARNVLSMGAHALRHTAATRMLRSGASLKDLADVLRHRSLDTTAIYTKVDLPTLAAVALPWPGARP
jgi:integrase/recombinase XerD